MRLTLRQPPPNETTPSSEGANEGQRAGNNTLHTSTPPPLARATTKTLTARGGGAPRRNALRPLVHYQEARSHQMAAQKSTEGERMDERLARIEGRLDQLDRLEGKIELLLGRRAASRLELPSSEGSSEERVERGIGTNIGTMDKEPRKALNRAGSCSNSQTWLGGVLTVLTPKCAQDDRSACSSASQAETETETSLRA